MKKFSLFILIICLSAIFLVSCGESASEAVSESTMASHVGEENQENENTSKEESTQAEGTDKKTIKSKTEKDADGTVTEYSTYDRNGNLLTKNQEEYTYDSNGTLLNIKSNNKIQYEYQYNNDGNLLTETRFNAPNEEDPYITEENTYDSNGNLLNKLKYVDGDWVDYSYDQDGNVLTEIGYKLSLDYSDVKSIDCSFSDSDDYSYNESEIYYLLVYTYDNNGDMLTKTYYQSNGLPAAWYEYTYDKKENMLIEDYYNSNGVLGQRAETRYDKDKNILSIITYQYGATEVKDLYEYTYDSNGNMLTSKYSVPYQINYYNDGSDPDIYYDVKEFNTYEYEYYD